MRGRNRHVHPPRCGLVHAAAHGRAPDLSGVSGRMHAEVAAAIRQVVPDAQADLPSGGETRQSWLDITRLHEDTGYKPAWDTERAAADYIAWLRAGNER